MAAGRTRQGRQMAQYIRFDQITDERNSPPIIKVKAAEPVETFVYIGDGIESRCRTRRT